ncbi:class I SAM-dependent methyltransferase [soil metagenome]
MSTTYARLLRRQGLLRYPALMSRKNEEAPEVTGHPPAKGMAPHLLRQHFELEERHWWFVARRKILLSVLERDLTRKIGLDILDAGCGGGATMESLRRYGKVLGMEFAEEAVTYNRARGRDVVEGSIEVMPFVDESFDLALALDVVEHVPDDARALSELYRVLRPGGSVLVTVPALDLLWSVHDEANGHYRRYTIAELQERVESAGFEVGRLTYFNTLLFPAILAARKLNQRRDGSDVGEVPEHLNSLLAGIFSSEARLLARLSFPVGVSAMCFARKPA